LKHLLAVVPMVEGVEAFLGDRGYTFYLSSSAPEAEVSEQLSRRNLDNYFAAVFGAGTPKATALRQVAARHPTMVPVFFGDSIGDWEAAKEARVAFVAVVSERDNFVGYQVAKLVDFTSPASVQANIQSALLLHAT
jgi:phosphoglycolate phosphatase-like HAD superfamily hydrolase